MDLNVKMSTKKGAFPKSLPLSFSCPYFPHHKEETQALQALQSNTILGDRGEKKAERPEQGNFKWVMNQVEAVTKCSTNLQKPDGTEQ